MGCSWLCDLGLHKVIIESDALQIVNMWKAKSYDRSEIAATLYEVLELTANMEHFQLQFTKREANELAHLCAKQANPVRCRCLWINYVPVFLVACISKDNACV